MDSKIADLEKMSKLATSRIHDNKGMTGFVFYKGKHCKENRDNAMN